MKLSRNDFGTQFLTVIGDAVFVFVSYLLAMFIRYHVWKLYPESIRIRCVVSSVFDGSCAV